MQPHFFLFFYQPWDLRSPSPPSSSLPRSSLPTQTTLSVLTVPMLVRYSLPHLPAVLSSHLQPLPRWVPRLRPLLPYLSRSSQPTPLPFPSPALMETPLVLPPRPLLALLLPVCNLLSFQMLHPCQMVRCFHYLFGMACDILRKPSCDIGSHKVSRSRQDTTHRLSWSSRVDQTSPGHWYWNPQLQCNGGRLVGYKNSPTVTDFLTIRWLSCQSRGGSGHQPLLVDLWWLYSWHWYYRVSWPQDLGFDLWWWPRILHYPAAWLPWFGKSQVYLLRRRLSCPFLPYYSSKWILETTSSCRSHLESSTPHDSIQWTDYCWIWMDQKDYAWRPWRDSKYDEAAIWWYRVRFLCTCEVVDLLIISLSEQWSCTCDCDCYGLDSCDVDTHNPYADIRYWW